MFPMWRSTSQERSGLYSHHDFRILTEACSQTVHRTRVLCQDGDRGLVPMQHLLDLVGWAHLGIRAHGVTNLTVVSLLQLRPGLKIVVPRTEARNKETREVGMPGITTEIPGEAIVADGIKNSIHSEIHIVEGHDHPRARDRRRHREGVGTEMKSMVGRSDGVRGIGRLTGSIAISADEWTSRSLCMCIPSITATIRQHVLSWDCAVNCPSVRVRAGPLSVPASAMALCMACLGCSNRGFTWIDAVVGVWRFHALKLQFMMARPFCSRRMTKRVAASMI